MKNVIGSVLIIDLVPPINYTDRKFMSFPPVILPVFSVVRITLATFSTDFHITPFVCFLLQKDDSNKAKQDDQE